MDATFAAFVAEAARLRALYRGRITLVLGMETELIHTASLAEAEAVWARHQGALDYRVGSVHHVGGTPIDLSPELYARALDAHGGDLEALFVAYYDAQYAMLTRLRPAVVGHFDVIRLFAPAGATYGAAARACIARNAAFIRA